ncbi:DUF4917 family protein, partial [Salinimicrobium sp. WS361]|uniref:DUF4917 family protein n=1 Tax=Salinimicrobium sp. WS361 TaxID=3425123 RepID=UPI003D6F1E22
YSEVLRYLGKKKRNKHLLVGNGFSMAYDHKIFSYNALYKFIENLEDPVLSQLFKVINTKNFEMVMQQLDNFIEIAEAFGSDQSLIKQLQEANQTLRNSLINAIKELHPEHVFEVPEEKSKTCSRFLNEFLDHEGNKIFTTNYDLLMYWVLMRNKTERAIDGFGREVENPDAYKTGEEFEYSDELIWGKHKDEQSVYYVHGTLPIFDNGIDIIKEVYTNGHYLLENVKERLDRKEYPVFVTAGNGEEKLKHIMHNRYLTHCYENLCKIEGSLITFGFNFGEYDEHIIDAINKAAKQGQRAGDKLFSIYIGVYSENDFNHIIQIQDKFRCKVNMYDAKSAPLWN